MISEKQLSANRKNAKKGGVKTEAGKMTSRLNAFKHGGMTNAILDDEADFYELAETSLLSAETTKSLVEKILVERAAMCVLQMRRLSFAESEFIRQIENPEVLEPLFELPGDKVIEQGYEPAISLEEIDCMLGLYLRYQTAIENRFLKITKELTALRSRA